MKVLPYKTKRKKFESNWLTKSLENLEKDNWGPVPQNESYLVTTCHKLRKKPLQALEVEDVRILIGQNIGLKYLIPLALEILEQNILAEGHLYEGDLLKAVLTSTTDYWRIEREDWNTLKSIYLNNVALIKEEASQYETGRGIIKAFRAFEKIH